MTPQQFIMSIAPAAVVFYRQHKISAALRIAQACLESEYGKNAPGNNLFGIKADPSWQGPTVDVPTQEFEGGKWITIQAKFRAYKTMGESLTDNGSFLLVNSRYKNLVGADYKTACNEIGKVDGYATDPTYSTKLLEIIAQFGLDKYDRPNETAKGRDNVTQPVPDSPAVQQVLKMGLMNNVSGANFEPDQPLTRGQAAALAVNLVNKFNASLAASNIVQHVTQQPAVANWLKQTVMINVFGTPNDQEAWWGAGVWIDPETILTAHHVTHSKNLQQEIDPTRFHLHTSDGVQIQGDSTWTITPHPSGWDLAIIKTTGTGRGARLNFDTPSPGEDCWTIGYPQAIPFYVSRGVVSTDHMPSVGEGPTFGVAIFGYEGNSGGPIFNAAGNLLGILVQGTLVPVGTAGVVDNFQIVAVPAWRP